MAHVCLAEAESAILIVIDMQERVLAAVPESERVVGATVRMLRAAKILGLPVLFTEQNPAGLGATAAAVREALPSGAAPIIKKTCSCWGEAAFRAALTGAGREQVLVVGVETHVCIQQTALELMRVDYEPFVLIDAVGSRRGTEHESAVTRMRQAGVTTTTVESMIFELAPRCDAAHFKDLLKLVR